jgi:hypothetical protein
VAYFINGVELEDEYHLRFVKDAYYHSIYPKEFGKAKLNPRTEYSASGRDSNPEPPAYKGLAANSFYRTRETKQSLPTSL